jgi:hypothetical protein
VFHEKLKNPDAFCWATEKSLAAKVACTTAADQGAAAAAAFAAAAPPAAGRAAPTAPAASSGRDRNASSWFLADFGRELQGGVILDVKSGR